MPGSIHLPIVAQELDDEQARLRSAAGQPPRTVVCRYGYMRYIGELLYDGKERPHCGNKLVIRSNRGIELAELLTTTCEGAGYPQAVTREQVQRYIEQSGGRDFPFTAEGRVLRIATTEDILEQQRLDSRKPEIIRFSRQVIMEMDLPMRLSEVELLLGGERIVFHYTSEQWVDFRELVRRLAHEYQTRIEMHQVNARDEARLVADFEKCGQHCCCRQFLKVLKAVSMRSAKIQKATLDPSKISGRCSRLMCCLRYEDETYDALRKRLPYRQTRQITPDGFGTVLETQILTQLALVQLDGQEKPVAYPVDSLRPLPREEDPAYKEGGPLARPGKKKDHRDADGQPDDDDSRSVRRNAMSGTTSGDQRRDRKAAAPLDDAVLPRDAGFDGQRDDNDYGRPSKMSAILPLDDEEQFDAQTPVLDESETDEARNNMFRSEPPPSAARTGQGHAGEEPFDAGMDDGADASDETKAVANTAGGASGKPMGSPDRPDGGYGNSNVPNKGEGGGRRRRRRRRRRGDRGGFGGGPNLSNGGGPRGGKPDGP